MQKRLVTAVLAALLALLAASPSVARASTPCWQRVISDWTADGVINGHYSPQCLRQASKNVHEDQRDYSSILDDINAALLDALAPKNSTNNSSGNGPGTSAANGKARTAKQVAAAAKRRAEQAVPHAGTSGSIPKSSRSLPLPLLILAGIAAAALLAAASTPLIQRIRARSPRPRPTPRPEP